MPEPIDANPYAVPASESAPPPAGESGPPPPARSFGVLAVVAGVAVDWGLTELLVPRYLDWLETRYGFEMLPQLLEGGPARWAWSGIGWGCSVVGGFVTGWLAHRKELAHGLANFALTAVILRLMAVRDDTAVRLDLDFLIAHSGNIASILVGAALAGGLRRIRARGATS